MSPPSHRELEVSDNYETINLERTLTLGVWNNRARLLLPSAETTPEAWADWAAAIGPIVHKSRPGWESPRVGGENRTTYELTTCRISAQRIRTPPRVCPKPTGPPGGRNGIPQQTPRQTR